MEVLIFIIAFVILFIGIPIVLIIAGIKGSIKVRRIAENLATKPWQPISQCCGAHAMQRYRDNGATLDGWDCSVCLKDCKLKA